MADTNSGAGAALTNEQLRTLAAQGIVRTLPKNTIVVSEGDETDSFFVIVDGGVRVGASREMVSRIFKDLVAGGYISIEKKRITIHKNPPKHW